MNQRERALRLLTEAGDGGMCGITLMQQGVGTRYAARIHELREMGHTIRREWCKNQWHNHRTTIARYYLEPKEPF